MDIQIIRANRDHALDVAALFDEYRAFYGQPRDPQGALDFISARLRKQDSVILFAWHLEEGYGMGFTQLYPSFSSVAMQRIYILNDLYVTASARRKGVAARLLRAAETFARAAGAIRLELATAPDNHAAQALYEAEEWLRDPFFHYSKST